VCGDQLANSGQKLDGPANVPMKDFWSFTVYDNQTRSMLQTDQQFPSVNSTDKGIMTNPGGSVDVWFAPTLPAGVNKANWAQTIPEKGWNPLFRADIETAVGEWTLIIGRQNQIPSTFATVRARTAKVDDPPEPQVVERAQHLRGHLNY